MSNEGRAKHFSEVAENLPQYHEDVKSARAVPLREGRTYSMLYFNRPSLIGRTGPQGDTMQVYSEDGLKQLGFNTLAECFRGGISQVARPLKPKVTSVGGDFKTSRSTRGLAPVLDGIAVTCKFREKATKALEDCLQWSEGLWLVEDDPLGGGRVCVSLDPANTFVSSMRDEVTTYRPKSRRWLKAMFASEETPEALALRDKIDNLPNYEPDAITGVTAGDAFKREDNVGVWEGWLAPIGDGVKAPGKHVMCVKGHTFIDEPWKIRLPVGGMPWADGYQGPSDGRPLGRSLAPLHAIEKAMQLKIEDGIVGAVAHVTGFNPPAKDAAEQPFSDVPWQILPMNEDQTFPQVVYPPGGSPEVKAHRDDVRETMHRQTGITAEAAEGAIPPGIESGIGIANYVAVINQSLSRQHGGYQRMHVDFAEINVALGPPAGKGDDALSQQVDWDLLKLPRSAYTVSFDVVSDLPNHLPFKLNLLEKLGPGQLGEIDAGEMISHIDDGDISAVTNRLSAERVYIEYQIDQALDFAVVEPPPPFQDRAKLAKNAASAWFQWRVNKVKPPRQNMNALLVLQRLAAGKGATPPLPGALPSVAPIVNANPLPVGAAPGTLPVPGGETPSLGSQLPPLATQ